MHPLDTLNQILGTRFQSWNDISDSELLRILVALKCAQLGVQVFVCGKVAKDIDAGEEAE